MTDAIRAAQAVLQDECDKLNKELAAKGYPGTTAQIWIGWNRSKVHATTYTDYRTPDAGVGFIDPSDDAATSIDRLRALIDETPALVDPDAYAAYFAWPQSGEAA